jgi:hypothetical protein
MGSLPSAEATSTSRWGTVSAVVDTSMDTFDAAAMWARSASSPSEMSIMAVAPMTAAIGPADSGGSGTL